MPLIADFLLNDISAVAQSACIDIAASFDACISLQEIKKDGWFNEVLMESENTSVVADIVGHRFLAYSIMLGLQITSIHHDTNIPENSILEFCTQNSAPQIMTLCDFQAQVSAALLAFPEINTKDVRFPVSLELACNLLGDLCLLTAPLFNISLQRLIVAPGKDDGVIVFFTTPDGAAIKTLAAFLTLIKDLIHQDMENSADKQIRLDFTPLNDALLAQKQGDNKKVIQLLQTWPGVLSALLRTSHTETLTSSQLGWISNGICALAQANYAEEKRAWAEELYRLGLQFVRDTEYAGPLFLHMGLILNDNKRYGEAIGFLRRAYVLNEDPGIVLPALAHALLERGRVFAAFLLLVEAKEKGVTSSLLRQDFAKISDILIECGVAWGKNSVE